MKGRCCLPRHPQYPDYGGRGIHVCDDWRDSFVAFLSHVGNRPSDSHSIDRIDNERGYEPGNVRWATMIQQAQNTRTVRRFDFFGESLTLTEAATKFGINRERLRGRILTCGISPEEAIQPGTLPVGWPSWKRNRA